MFATMIETLDLSQFDLVVIAFGAVLTSVVHGASGIAGGFLMAAVLVPILGVKAVMPVLSVTMLITGATRSLMNPRLIDWRTLITLIAPAVPAVLIVGSFYGNLSGSFVAALLGCVMLVSLVVRRVADRLKFHVGRRDLAIVGAIWGGLTGASIGPGLLVIPFLLNYGLRRETLVITMSASAIVLHVFRITAYAGAGQLSTDLALLGAMIGLLSLPGNWMGRAVLRRISDDQHVRWLEILLLLGAVNFFWVAIR